MYISSAVFVNLKTNSKLPYETLWITKSLFYVSMQIANKPYSYLINVHEDLAAQIFLEVN